MKKLLLLLIIILLFQEILSFEQRCLDVSKFNNKSSKKKNEVELEDIILAYYRYQGVRSMNMITCPSNTTGKY